MLDYIYIVALGYSCCLFSFSMTLSATRLSRGRVPILTSDNLICCLTETEQEDHDFVSAGHILTLTQAVGSGRMKGGLNPQPPMLCQLNPPPPPPRVAAPQNVYNLSYWTYFCPKYLYHLICLSPCLFWHESPEITISCGMGL